MEEADRDRLVREISALVREVPAAILQGCAASLEATPAAARASWVHHGEHFARILGMAAGDPGLLAGIALALRVAARAVADERGAETVELVWTGPEGPASGLRRIDQALLDLVEEARTSLLLVTFAAGRVPVLAEALERADARGVDFVYVGDSEERCGELGPGDVVRALGPVLAARARSYTWPAGARPAGASLHAKCAVADDRVILISSANLTEAALGANMELGAVIRGGPHPRKVSGHFRHLIAQGVLVPAGREA